MWGTLGVINATVLSCFWYIDSKNPHHSAYNTGYFDWSYLLWQVGLADKSNTVVKALSGGMRRKLSLGIALIGDSKVCLKRKSHPYLFPLLLLLLVFRGVKFSGIVYCFSLTGYNSWWTYQWDGSILDAFDMAVNKENEEGQDNITDNTFNGWSWWTCGSDCYHG